MLIARLQRLEKKREIHDCISLFQAVQFHLNEANGWESYVKAQWPQLA